MCNFYCKIIIQLCLLISSCKFEYFFFPHFFPFLYFWLWWLPVNVIDSCNEDKFMFKSKKYEYYFKFLGLKTLSSLQNVLYLIFYQLDCTMDGLSIHRILRLPLQSVDSVTISWWRKSLPVNRMVQKVSWSLKVCKSNFDLSRSRGNLWRKTGAIFTRYLPRIHYETTVIVVTSHLSC